MPLIRIRDVGKDSSETFYSGDFDEKFIVKPGDILIGMDGDFRLAVWQGERALLNQRVCKVESKGEVIDRGYLIHMLPRELQRIEDSTSYATVKHLSVKKIKAIEMPLPPLEEQKRIAGILDEADRVRKKTQALIDKYDELAQSLFLDMFGDPVTNPKGWEVKPLGSIVKLENGDRGKGYPKPTDISDDGIPWLNAGDLNGGYATLTQAKRISIEAYHRMSRGKFNDGDILFCLRGSVGKHGLVSDFSGAIASSLVILRKSEVVNSSFLSFWLSSRKAKIEIDKRQNGSSQPNLGANDLKEFELFLPPRELQNAFKSKLEILETSKRHISLHAMQTLFTALLQKAFKGEL